MQLNKTKLFLTLSSGFFLSFVLYIYEAFGIFQGISFSGHSLLFRSIAFGIGVSATYGINEFFIKSRIAIYGKARMLAWILWEIWIASITTFLLFNYFWNFEELYWSSYFLLLGEFFSVMLLPHGLTYLFEKLNRNGVDLMTITSENGKERIDVNPSHLLFIQADDNYIKVVTSEKDRRKSKLIRQTLTNVEDQLKDYRELVRVHRSYLINKSNVRSIERKSKSGVVHFDNNESVPISQKYLDQL
ncbi:LytR/AlgR family response regulator transcription factor [Ekhidna sp.]